MIGIGMLIMGAWFLWPNGLHLLQYLHDALIVPRWGNDPTELVFITPILAASGVILLLIGVKLITGKAPRPG